MSMYVLYLYFIALSIVIHNNYGIDEEPSYRQYVLSLINGQVKLIISVLRSKLFGRF